MGRRREPEASGARGALPGLLAVLTALTLVSGCSPEEPPPSDPELRAALGIADDVAIHRVDLAGGGDVPPVRPASIVVRSGDVVQFVVLDHRAYLLRFHEDRIAPHILEFLRATAQDRPPPLVDEGARLVLSFEGAPTGAYPFQVEGNGPPVTGEIRVVAP